MKRIVALFLMLLLLCNAFAVFAEEEKFPGYYTPPHMTEDQYPLDEEVTLSYWMYMNAPAPIYISSYAENAGYIQAQKDTGVNLEFLHPTIGAEKESFDLMLNSGKLPDMIQLWDKDLYPGGLEAMYEDGIIVDLTPYLDELAPQYKEVIEHNKLGYLQTHSDDKVLGFWKITYADKIPYVRFNANKDWLDEAGMKEPKTVEEYEAFFDWVLANKPGVTPLFFGMTVDQQMNLTMGNFDMLYDWYLDREDGKTVRHWANSEQYKDWLTLMNRWYDKGYFSRDFMSLTMSEVQAMFDAGKIACYSDSVDATFSRLRGVFNVTNFPYMRPTEDYVLGSNLAANPVGDGGDFVTVITTSCEDVEAAIRYLNYGYTFEGAMPFNFGVEGMSWNWGDDGFPKFTDLMINNPDGLDLAAVCYILKTHFASRYCYPDDIAIPPSDAENTAMKIRTLWIDDKNEQNFLQIPPISLTAEETEERSDIMIQVETFAMEKMIQFITGAESLDNFDDYIAEVEDLGLNRAIEITQNAVDRFQAE